MFMADIPRIQIEQQAARIGISTINAKVQVNDKPRPKMRIVSEPAHMEIEHKAPAFKVETQRSRSERPALSRNYAAAPLPAPRAKTPRPAADTAPAAGENSKPQNKALSPSINPLVLNKAINEYASSANNVTITQSMPSIEWEAGYLNITWSNAQMQIEWDQGNYMPSFSVEPHSVEIYLREKPYIKITISDEAVAAMYSPQMDKQV
jgi:hypothetical protein